MMELGMHVVDWHRNIQTSSAEQFVVDFKRRKTLVFKLERFTVFWQ
jgi:hypothetical protein